MTTFVQIHTLRDYVPSWPNRGADGLAKRWHYGDAERQRISSQCIKAALRKPTLGLAELAAELGLDMSVRSGAAISRFFAGLRSLMRTGRTAAVHSL